MFTGFSIMLQAFFRALTNMATMIEKFASAGNRIAEWTDDTAASFADQARVEREQKLAVHKHNIAQQKIRLANTQGEIVTEAPAPVPTPEAAVV